MSNSTLDFTSFFPRDMEIKNIIQTDDEIHIYLKSHTHTQICPTCGESCHEYHSTYKRKMQDLPILGKRVYLFITAYRYYCPNHTCLQKVFCETIDGLYGTYKRMTERLESFLTILALHTSCEGAARVANEINIKVSGDAIIHLLVEKSKELEPVLTDSIGVDDWANRKSTTYGTIIVDGNTHKPLELLNGRDGVELKKWLAHNKQVKIVTRDRASAYAKVINEELPKAIQVADRFHLHQNLLEAIKKALNQEIPARTKIAQEISIDNNKENIPVKKTKNKEKKKHL